MVLWFELREVGPWCNCQVPSTQKKKKKWQVAGLVCGPEGLVGGG